MKITVVGAGYVGLVTGACFADWGQHVTCVDIDEVKIEQLNAGKIPIYEPGLGEMVDRNATRGNLLFSVDIEKSIEGADIVVNAVGTPLNKDGKADLSAVMEVARVFGQSVESYALFVNKSTIPLGASTQVREGIQSELDKRNSPEGNAPGFFDMVNNPEFLKEGTAIQDFVNPDRVVIGVDSDRAEKMMKALYAPLIKKGVPLVITTLIDAEAIKYASNAFLATKISFINEMAHLCEQQGANIEEVARGMGLDPRIGPEFLRAGIGYGGSCLPKDVAQLIVSGEEKGVPMEVLKATQKINKNQPKRLLEKLDEEIEDLDGRTIAVWGLTFKPETDDIREAPALTIIPALIEKGAKVQVFDPKGMEATREVLGGNSIDYKDDLYAALEGADALLILTEWDMFKQADMSKVRNSLGKMVVIDGRNLYDLNEMKSRGFIYKSIGRN